MTLRAQVSFSGENTPAVGRERIRLLEAVGREGSISGAARAVGITYKAAWDAIDAMNNLFGHPLVEGKAGGRRGGGAALTPAGLGVIETFHRLEGALSRTFADLAPGLAGTGITTSDLLQGFLMRTSARNALRGTVAAVTEGGVNAEVTLALGDRTTLVATVTRDSVRQLGLVPGRPALALIKASFVVLVADDPGLQTTVRNRIPGTVIRREDGEVHAEVTLDIAEGKTLTAVVTRIGADDLSIAPGRRVAALVDASHVILAVA
ncbi:TOBE domain-containing protein [Azospirillum halopraeferens]|uniref:TOBE domain-containing protein n=1 Tax=Azospirillum halopraeferens TaxID=34010 RepID=UPI0004917035|nr:TOBE domain-containing protein [Azospirillum halopraeferens]